MKSIKELGLELIELKDQILLVEKINSTCGKWILVDWDEYGYFVDTTEHDRDYGGKDKNVIASTVQLQGLPLLVIEDDVNFTIQDRNFQKQTMNPYPVEEYAFTAYEKGFIEGYNKSTEFHNKAKETYKFTEEDLVRAFNVGTNASFEGHSKNLSKDELMDFYSKKLHNLNQSLTKKELFIEVEEYDHSQNITDRCKFRPNVSQGKIKAIWK